MNQTEAIAALETEVERQKQLISELVSELSEVRQRLELRNLSSERLQAQFTVAAEAVSKLLAERGQIRNSRWARLGSWLGFLPKLRDELR